MSRHLAREVSFQYLYRFHYLPLDAQSTHLQELIFTLGINLEDELQSFAKQLIQGTQENEAELKTELEKYLEKSWRIERLSKVDLTILLLAMYELKFTKDIPANVVINEAIEMAKKFGNEHSSAFINGVLDKVAHA